MFLMPVTGTAKPRRRATHPPLVIGTITGSLVASLNSAGDTTRTGRSFVIFSDEWRGFPSVICRGRSGATGRQLTAISGRSSTPLHGHSNVGFTAYSGPSLDDAVQRVVGLCRHSGDDVGEAATGRFPAVPTPIAANVRAHSPPLRALDPHP